ncbi:hypothetical protein SAY86_008380 [Trapa natans]|uniref:Uncharacterized protein n=1 Tax=Trapa natans TaxID=22666 RepID=A0AAN7KA18_TRANT|nr:hypothetical protein SAY86_008380 [Trapa natans]
MAAADRFQELKRKREEVEEEPETLALDSEKQQQMHQNITIKLQNSSSSSSSSSQPLTRSATSELDSDVVSAASEEKVDRRERERVLLHLLDDELGLPSREEGTNSSSIMSESALFSLNAMDGEALMRLLTTTRSCGPSFSWRVTIPIGLTIDEGS